MTNSATSTEQPPPSADTGFRPWHFYILLSMAGATAAVMLARETHPAALLLLSGAVVAAGVVGLAMHHALGGLLGVTEEPVGPIGATVRESLEHEKRLALRAIKELEFDRAMRKVSEPDFEDMRARLRARAMMLMQELESHTEPTPSALAAGSVASGCATCGTQNDLDARFCKQCGAALSSKGAA